ncbi:MAG TPA: sugar ABC transporter permease [Ktedonobacteraceae bacterium]|nr:sugar ABC transporter permease [Ktedonobacteraceae bacterium]
MALETSGGVKLAGAKRGRYSSLQKRIMVAGVIFIAPATLYTLIFQIFPVIYALYLSFTNASSSNVQGSQFQGLEGYREVLLSPEFWNALRVTVQYTIEVVPLAMAFSLGLALLANRRMRGITFFRAAFYLPNIISLTAVSLVWMWLYSNDGFFNYVGSLVGLEHIRWLSSPAIALHALVGMRVWKALGGNMVLFLAGLQGIPEELYEAASIDGAGSWARFCHVTLPGLQPVIVYVATADLIYLAQSFSEVYIMTSGGPIDSTTTMNLLIYNQAFQYNQIGQASAMAFLLFIVIFAFAFFNVRVMTRRANA